MPPSVCKRTFVSVTQGFRVSRRLNFIHLTMGLKFGRFQTQNSTCTDFNAVINEEDLFQLLFAYIKLSASEVEERRSTLVCFKYKIWNRR